MDSKPETKAVELSFLQGEFLAEDEQIQILPMVRSDVITLIRGNFGPFEPSVHTTVPVWLALALKKVQRCKIVPPSWMEQAMLEALIAAEKVHEDELRPINFYFFELAALLLHHAPDDLVDSQTTRRLVEDVRNLRDSKMRKWMQSDIRVRVNGVKVPNLSLHEINAHRPILTRVLDQLYTMHVAPDLTGSQTDADATPSASNAGATPQSATAAPASASESERRPVQGRQLRRVIRS